MSFIEQCNNDEFKKMYNATLCFCISKARDRKSGRIRKDTIEKLADTYKTKECTGIPVDVEKAMQTYLIGRDWKALVTFIKEDAQTILGKESKYTHGPLHSNWAARHSRGANAVRYRW